MTPADRASGAAAPSREPHVFRVRDQGELIAAVPAMLGFHPRESLVLMATGGRSGRRLGLTLRVDLPPPEHPHYVEHAEVVADAGVRGLLLDDPAGAVAIVVSEADAARGDPLPHARLAGRVGLALAERDIGVQALLWAERTAGGARWACYDTCGCTGVVADPAATAFVAALVAEGRVVHPDRAALRALVTPADPGRIRRREELLVREIDGLTGGARSQVLVDAPVALDAVDAAIADAAAGRLTLPDTRVVALATALAVREVRDAAVQRTGGPHAPAAEQLWAALCRETPDPEAAEPAALLAVSALLRGDGALANVALDRAEQAWPGHAFAGLLRGVADRGLRPSRVRALLRIRTGPAAAGSRGRG